MSQVNLLPPQVREKGKARNRAILVGIGGAVLLGLLVMYYLTQTVALQSAERHVIAQTTVNSGLQRTVTDLQPFQQRKTDVDQQQGLLDSAMGYEVSWSGVLRDLALYLPDGMSITSFSGTISTSTGTPPAPLEDGSIIVGTISIQGEALDTLLLAKSLARLDQVSGWGNPWVQSANLVTSGIWTYSTSVDLFKGALTARGSNLPVPAPVAVPSASQTP